LAKFTKPKHVAGNETNIILVAPDSWYFLFTERGSLGMARECESDDVDKAMM